MRLRAARAAARRRVSAARSALRAAAAGLTALVGALTLTAGVGLAAALVWSPLAGLAACLIAVGGGLLYAGLAFDFDRKG